VVVDCGAVVGTLIESELFGHEKGAFTGAVERRQGAFELATGGTLFLDEIGELPLELQPKLLRALETRRIRRVGGSQGIPLDIRVIAASNRNLQMEVERGKFREDLYFRLAVVPVRLPPLRERRSDVPLLARELLAAIGTQLDPQAPPLSMGTDITDALATHDWPGNVRELRNILERAAYLARAQGQHTITSVGAVLGAATSTTTGASSTPVSTAPSFDATESYRATRERWENDFELRYVTWLLERHDGNVSAAAREADMDRKHLHKLAKKHGLREG
jgi:transcriptional regulator with GAF, ATPase, and Fis domain